MSNMDKADRIALFVSRYRREYDFYYELARLVSQECDALTTENGIRAIVTFRAKSPDRLEGKLRQRSPEKNYRTEEDIRADMVDLSGVRIALYFPGDRARVGALLRGVFIVDKEKQFPDKPKVPVHRFDGYHAEHYRVRLKPGGLPESQRRYVDSTVEIQVASVLMHAWSEVEHDLNYKQLSGQVSQEERAILDGINGIVLSGEVFLERLQAAFEARVSRKGSTFSNQYELAAFLYDRLRASMTTGGLSEPVTGRIDILFRLLQLAGLNRPDDLPPFLQSLDLETERQPVADQVIDRVLASRSDLYDQYIEMRRVVGGGGRTFFVGQGQPSPEIVGRFIHKWVIFERFLRAITAARKIPDRRYMLPTGNLLKSVGLSESFQVQLNDLRRIRNNLIHGVNTPGEDQISAADKDLDDILNMLELSTDPEICEAMKWAISGEPDRSEG